MKTFKSKQTLTFCSRVLVATLALAATAHAQNIDQYKPKEVESSSEGNVEFGSSMASGDVADAKILDKLNGLVFVADPADVSKEALSTEGVTFKGVDLLQDSTFVETTSMMIGEPFTMADLDQLRKSIVLHYRSSNRPIVDVIPPEQDVTNGVIQVLVIEGKLGEVRIEGNEHFSTEMIEKYISLESGDAIDAGKVKFDHKLLNANPFRKANVMFEKGSNPGETDMVVKIKDHRPWRVYGGYSNNGNELTGKSRFFGGVNWGNAFDRDIVMGYQFTMAEDLEDLNAHALSASIPLQNRHKLSLIASLANTEARIASDPIVLDGESWQLSARYIIPTYATTRFAKYDGEFILGFDLKSTNNTIEFGGTQVSDNTVEISQFSLGYAGTLSDKYGSTKFNVTGFYSPGGLFGDNDDADFEAFRYKAESEYAYLRASLSRTTRLGSSPFSLFTRASGQIASSNLLPSEQLGVGGFSSVRGYEEREASADTGFIVSNQIQYQPFSLIANTDHEKLKDKTDMFVGYVFLDYGQTSLVDELPGQDGEATLISVGPGFNYRFDKHMTLSFDWGFQLEDSDRSPTGDSHRAHVNFSVSY